MHHRTLQQGTVTANYERWRVAKPIALTQQSSSKEESFGSPYLFARREWDERYGGLIKQAQQWRGAAVLALLVALAEAIVIIGVATRPRTAPYVVAVDSLGRVAAAGAIDRTFPIDERMKQASITQWVQYMRGVTSDGLAERAAIDHVYAMTGSQSAAQTIVTDYFRANQPFERGSRETVQVEVNAILPNSPHSYEVDWTETQRTLDGKPISSDKWRGIFTVAINPPTDEAVLRVNPFGIYIIDITWSKVL
jgi:type IV secretion system protein TrbF